MKPGQTEPKKWPRNSGVLLHVSSLPGPYGIGDLGIVAHAWVDLLASAGQTWWQILPLGPAGAGHSPYQCYSAFAGNPLLIGLEILRDHGWLTNAELAAARQPAGDVDFERVSAIKLPLLAKAADRFFAQRANPPRIDRSKPHGVGAVRGTAAAYERFVADNAGWLDDYALFTALRFAHKTADWTRWPAGIAARKKASLADARERFAAEIDRERFIQFCFFQQLKQLRDRATKVGIKLIGDVPIFVSAHSADVWVHRAQFEVDAKGRPTAVAGVPPDLFSADGQRWGNPLYRWKAMQRDGFSWWIERMRASLLQADIVRLDHFRGFEAYWRIPAKSKTARHGKWVKSPGHALLTAIRDGLGGLPLIAEDLGIITPAVEELRAAFHLPGMRVLQFAFGGGSDNPHLAHHHASRGVVYTGTHDNDTSAGWYRSLTPPERKALHDYLPGAKSPVSACWALIEEAMASVSTLAVVPAQDLLALPSPARMNTPGVGNGNWRWRLDSLSSLRGPLRRLEKIAKRYARKRLGSD